MIAVPASMLPSVFFEIAGEVLFYISFGEALLILEEAIEHSPNEDMAYYDLLSALINLERMGYMNIARIGKAHRNKDSTVFEIHLARHPHEPTETYFICKWHD